jgi:hypothetical protein
MKAIAVTFAAAIAAAAQGQYKVQSAGAPPSDVPAALAGKLEKDGAKIVDGSGKTVAEIWLVTDLKKGPKSAEESVTLPEIPQGTFLGVLRAAGPYTDRRGQQIKPGVYTLRYSDMPINGDHQGAAPQRDFAVLSRIADDTDPNSTPAFDALMAQSRKASGTPHPLVLSMWKADAPNPALTNEGESDWVLTRKAGDTMVSIIVIGKASS